MFSSFLITSIIVVLRFIDSTRGADSCHDFVVDATQGFAGWSYGTLDATEKFQEMSMFEHDSDAESQIWYNGEQMRGADSYKIPHISGSYRCVASCIQYHYF
jgi:16S rRNA C1402 N4-methylase RsmH